MNSDLILRTNELENAIDYLEKVTYYFSNRSDDYWFKWLMISLHGALYGFGVCAIKGTSSERVIEIKLKQTKFELKKQEIAQLYQNEFDITLEDEVLEATARYNIGQLLGIWEVIKYCESKAFMMQNNESKYLVLTPNQKRAIKKMVDYRNDFAHFKPKSISVITQSEEWIIKEVVEVIEFLSLKSGNVFYPEVRVRRKVSGLINLFS
ncbi:hypothetical protein [Fictibacillus sp. JL2B1089]|uniref:hypothetical protein n=1 Tax=Fictibacillus sp. JL2B1089 TaxID=3399565 RepID=UPI003A89F3F6